MIKITCIECGKEEILSLGWEKLLKDRPDFQPPKRCAECRKKRKQQRFEDFEHRKSGKITHGADY